MKEYHASSLIASVPLVLVAPFAIIADYFDEWFEWAYDAYFLALLICVLFYILTPFKYFPLFSSLCIDNNFITKRLFGVYVTRKMSCKQVYIKYLRLHGEYYIVFSQSDIPNAKKDILHAVHLRRAILFPWNPSIKLDFPELFA